MPTGTVDASRTTAAARYYLSRLHSAGGFESAPELSKPEGCRWQRSLGLDTISRSYPLVLKCLWHYANA